MTEHDTPSTARTEDNGWGCTFHRHFASNAIHRDNLDCPATDSDRPVYVFDPDVLDAHDAAVRETVMAQVREGLEALERELLAPVPRYGAFRRSVIELRNEGVRLALAVVDRLEGKP